MANPHNARMLLVDEDEVVVQRADWVELEQTILDLVNMLRECEAHCSDGYVAEKARRLIAHIDGPVLP